MKRLSFIDYLRGLAIILMFITHSFRLQKPLAASEGWTEAVSIFLEFFMFIEPFTPALFLFIAGFSLQLAFKKDPNTKGWSWLKRHYKIFMWSFIIALFAEGFYPERFFLSSGILQSIGTGLLISSFLLGRKYESLILASLTCLFAAGGFGLDHLQIEQAPLNAGLGVWFPQLGFIFAGGLYAIHRERIPKGFKDLVLICVIILYTSNLEWVKMITTTSNGWSLNSLSYHVKEFKNWNHSGWGFLANLSLVFLLVDGVANFRFKLPFSSFMTAIGSRALTLYVYHLSVISVFYAMNWNFSSPFQSLSFIILLLLGAFGISKTKLIL